MAGRRYQMEYLIHLVKQLYGQHTAVLFLAVLCVLVVLMIMNLLAVRRCRRQIKYLGDKSRDVMKLALSQKISGRENEQKYEDNESRKNDRRTRGHAVSKADEELFGSVMREMFP